MKPYSYVFGDHTLFLRRNVYSWPALERAICACPTGPLLHVYEGADWACNMDALVGGKFVMVVDWQALMLRLDANWFGHIKSLHALDILERYVRRLVRCRLKEQV